MRYSHLAALVLASAVLAGCGGGGAGSQAPKVSFTSQVSFGDSLSDVGTYKVGAVAAVGGGQFTINGAGKNWTELMAAQVGLTAPCAAVKGGFGVAPTTTASCYGYAQGGARVTNPAGIGYAAANAGALTYPVATQVANHLTAVGGSFSGNEVVYVLAGANDVLTQAGTYPVLISTYGQTSAQAMTTVTTAVTTAATDLATLVTSQMIAKGAKYVVVVNIPDVSNTPYAKSKGAATMGLIDTLVTTFNTQLHTQLAGNANVLLVDAYTVNRDQVNNPAPYGLTDVSGTACDVKGTFLNTNFNASADPFGGSSLGCSIANPASITAGVTADTHYLFADGVHPTPYGHWLLARYVAKEMLVKGWL